MHFLQKFIRAAASFVSPRKVARAIRTLRWYAVPSYPPICAPDPEYAAYLAGCSVVLVGPAPTIVDSKQHDHIESYDRVVRINHALPVPQNMMQDIGERTDIWYHNMFYQHPRALPAPELIRLAADTVDWLCSTKPYLNVDDNWRFMDEIDHYQPYLNNSMRFRTIRPRPYIRNSWRAGTHLNAGVSAILDLLAFDVRKLYITGFTFYAGKQEYHTGYKGKGSSKYHKQDTQRELVKALVRRDGRIKLDEGLRRAFADG